MTITEQKQQLRAQMRAAKTQFSSTELAAKSASIIAQLQADATFASAKAVMLYWSLPDEVETHTLIQQILPNKRIILPIVCGNDILPVELKSLNDLHEGQFHIQEPRNEVYTGQIDLIVVPGMAFTREGARLGRGKGYYDRFLSTHRSVPTIGLAFDFQMVSAVPTEANDIILGKVIFG